MIRCDQEPALSSRLFQLHNIETIGSGNPFIIVDGPATDERCLGRLAGKRDHDRVAQMTMRRRGGRWNELPQDAALVVAELLAAAVWKRRRRRGRVHRPRRRGLLHLNEHGTEWRVA